MSRRTLCIIGVVGCSPFSKPAPAPEGALDSAVEVDSADTGEAPEPDIRAWRGTRALTVPDLEEDARYGRSLASVDSDGDGAEELFVGAYKTRTHADRAGQVWRYPTLETDAREAIDPPGPHTLQRFGAHFAEVGDVDGDGYDDLAVTALGDDAEGYRAGAVYLLHGSMKGPDRDRDVRLTSSEPGREHEYGTSLTALGDIDGDGTGDLAVGDTHARDFEGVVEVWLGGVSPERVQVFLPDGAGSDGSSFGSRVRGGDLDGDGQRELLAGTSTRFWRFPDAGPGAADPVLLDLGLQDERGTWPVLGTTGDLDGDGADDIGTTGQATLLFGSPEGPTATSVSLSVDDTALLVHDLAILPGQGVLLSDVSRTTDIGVGTVFWWTEDALSEPGLPVVPPDGVFVACFGSDFARVDDVVVVGDSCAEGKSGQVVLFEAELE